MRGPATMPSSCRTAPPRAPGSAQKSSLQIGRRRWGRGSLRGLPGEQRAQPLAKRLQDGYGDERVLADHVVELATRQHETFHGRQGRHRRCTGTAVKKGDLTEEIARAQLSEMPTLPAHLRGPGEDHKELAACGALATEVASRDEVDFIDLRRDEGELLIVALREERNGLQHRDAGISHCAGG